MAEIKKDIIIGDTNYSNPIKGKEQQVIDAFVKVYGEKHRENITNKILSTHYFSGYEKDFSNPNQQEQMVKHIIKDKRRDTFVGYFEKAFGDSFKNNSRLFLMTDKEVENVSLNEITPLFERMKNVDGYKARVLNENELDTAHNFCRIIGYDKQLYELNDENVDELIGMANQFDKVRDANIEKDLSSIYFSSEKALENARHNDATTQKALNEKIDFFKQNYGKFIDGFGELPQEKQTEIAKGIALSAINTKMYENDASVNSAKDFFKVEGASFIDKAVRDCVWNSDNEHYKENLSAYLDLRHDLKYLDNDYISQFENDGIELSDDSKARIERDYRIDNLERENEGTLGYHTNFFTKDKDSVSVISCDSKDLTDSTIIHEFGHAVTTSNMFKDGDFVRKVGSMNKLFDLETETLKNGSAIRNQVRFMEVINEYYTQKVTDELHNDGVTLISDEKTPCDYELAFPLFDKMLDKYGEQIKEAYISDDTQAFEKLFGKELFDELQGLANRTVGKFPTQIDEMQNEADALFEKVDSHLKEKHNEQVRTGEHNRENEQVRDGKQAKVNEKQVEQEAKAVLKEIHKHQNQAEAAEEEAPSQAPVFERATAQLVEEAPAVAPIEQEPAFAVPNQEQGMVQAPVMNMGI